MQSITAALATILKSKFMAGATAGHYQQVLISAAGLGISNLQNFYHPVTTAMPNGQAAILFRAKETPYGAADQHVYFMRYKTESSAYAPVRLFDYDTIVYGLVKWDNKVLAVCWNPTTLKLRYRISSDNGVTFTAEADLMARTFATTEVRWGGGSSNAFQLYAIGTELFVFFINTTSPRKIWYRVTTNADPSLGWSAADVDTGFTIPSVGRNYGGSSARNQGDSIAFSIAKSKGTLTIDVGSGPASTGKTYTKDQTPHPSYPDTGGVELTDGNLGADNNFGASWTGFDAVSVVNVTIDLGASSSTIELLRASFYRSEGDGIYRPASVEYFTSPDNVTYTSQGTTLLAAATNDSGNRWLYNKTFSPTLTARYVRFKCTYTQQWMFIGECQVYETGGIVLENKDAWNVAAESDDGDWHANHMAAQGWLPSGTWTRKLNAGYGGGLSGGQGANGGIFRDRNNDLIFYVMSDDGNSVTVYRSLDSGATWTSLYANVIPAGWSVALGNGAGFYIAAYVKKEFIWGGTAGLSPVAAPAYADSNNLNVIQLDGGASAANFDQLAGPAAPGFFEGLGVYGTPTDYSSRVININLDRSMGTDSDGFNIELSNQDAAINLMNNTTTATALHAKIQPNSKVEIYQWYGAVANKVKTFTGIIDSCSEHDAPHTVTITGRDWAKKLLTQEIITIGAQDFDASPAPIQTMANGVYINKTAKEVLLDLLNYWGQIPGAQTAGVAGSNYLFKKYIVSDGTKVIDAIKRACDLAGLEIWADEFGNFVTAPIAARQLALAYTFRAIEDITVVDPTVSDDTTFTRVRILGRANIGAKYLSETSIWPGLGDPRGIAFDPTDGRVWYLNGPTGNLYKLDPASNMAVVSGPVNLGLANAESLARDSVDGHLWVVDGFDATTGASVNRKYKKVNNSTGATMLGPFTTPGGGLHARVENKSNTELVFLGFSAPSSIYTTDKAGSAPSSTVTAPINNGMGLTLDGGGGLFMTAQDSADIFQTDFAGNLINTIAGPAKDPTELTINATGDVYAVYQPWNSIVLYTVVTDPAGVATATLAEAADVTLEQTLSEKRLLRLTDMAITDKAQAQWAANRHLQRVKQYSKSLTIGVIAHPGLQKNDKVQIVAPGSTLNGYWVVQSIRTEQNAPNNTYLAVLVLQPYIGTGV